MLLFRSRMRLMRGKEDADGGGDLGALAITAAATSIAGDGLLTWLRLVELENEDSAALAAVTDDLTWSV